MLSDGVSKFEKYNATTKTYFIEVLEANATKSSYGMFNLLEILTFSTDYPGCSIYNISSMRTKEGVVPENLT